MSITGKKILVYDTGLSLEHALRLAKDGNTVYYFTYFANAFPKFQDFSIGLGFEDEGLIKIKHFWDYIDKVDYIVSFDIGAGDIMHYLKQVTDKPIFSAGKGELLEENRFMMRQIQKKIGLPLQKTVRVKGITALREFLKKNDNKYVKLDIFRGDVDSFYAKDYESSEMILDEIESAFGAFKEQKEFIIEDYIEAITEFGADVFFNSQQFIKPYLFGREMSKASYIGKFSDDIPSILQNTLDKLTPVLKKYDYRGAFSTEERIVSTTKGYLIDICTRLPFPLSAGYTTAIKNYTELIFAVAEGKSITIQPAAKYMVTLPLESQHGEKNWVRLDFDKKLRDEGKIKLRCATKIKGKYYMVKGVTTAFILVAIGNDLEECVKDIEKTSEKVEALGLDKDVIGGLHKTLEEVNGINKKLKWDF